MGGQKWKRRKCKGLERSILRICIVWIQKTMLQSNLLSIEGKIYTGVLVYSIFKVIEELTPDEQGGFRSGKGCANQIFTLKQSDEKAQKKQCVCWFSSLGEGT